MILCNISIHEKHMLISMYLWYITYHIHNHQFITSLIRAMNSSGLVTVQRVLRQIWQCMSINTEVYGPYTITFIFVYKSQYCTSITEMLERTIKQSISICNSVVHLHHAAQYSIFAIKDITYKHPSLALQTNLYRKQKCELWQLWSCFTKKQQILALPSLFTMQPRLV